jgi:hypothetical protein
MELLPDATIAVALVVGALGAITARMRWSWPGGLAFLLDYIVLGFVFLMSLWKYMATAAAPEPYLDEVFHIPQAQVYCEGRFDVWDDKITTPPGL